MLATKSLNYLRIKAALRKKKRKEKYEELFKVSKEKTILQYIVKFNQICLKSVKLKTFNI